MIFHFVNAVEQVITEKQACVYVVDLDETIEKENKTFRELIRTAFADKGIEIEFSGKGANERGVIIDMDEAQLLSQNIDPEKFRFGQTVVRVKH